MIEFSLQSRCNEKIFFEIFRKTSKTKNKADRHKSHAPRKQRPTDGQTDGPTKRLIQLRARD